MDMINGKADEQKIVSCDNLEWQFKVLILCMVFKGTNIHSIHVQYW